MTNFFISYNQADREWAEWIAWQLEEAGYTTILQDWDFRPADNFILKINNAIQDSERLIAVLSPDYITSNFAAAEWAAAFAQDPKGEQGILLPVKVRECDLKGFFKGIIHIDLVGMDEAEAAKALLDGILLDRAYPLTKPDFPTTSERQITEHPLFPEPKAGRFFTKSRAAFLIILGVLITGAVYGLWLRYKPMPIPPQPCIKSTSGDVLYYEAENAELGGSASKHSEQLGYSGNGYVSGYGGELEASTTFPVDVPSDGQYQLDLCYANANRSARTLSIYVNEVPVKETRLPTTSHWESWLMQSETLPLKAGRNAISYRKTAGYMGQVNLDFLGVLQKPIVTPTPSPTATARTPSPSPSVSPSPSPSVTPTPGTVGPTTDEMKQAVLREYIKRGGTLIEPNKVRFNFLIGGMTITINKFVKLGCKPAGYGVGFECTYTINISNVMHSDDPGIQQRLNYLNMIPIGENTLTQKFVLSDDGWIMFQEQK